MQPINSFILEKFGRSPLDTKEAIRRSTQSRVDTYNETSGKDDNTGVHCELCKDRGLIAFMDSETGNFTTRTCQCYGTRLTVQRLQRAGIWENAKRCRLENFETDTATRKAMRDTVERYVEDPAGHWLLICGQSGAGKTHLCTGAFVALTHTLGLDAQYLLWNADGRKLKAASMEDEQGLWERYKETPLLYVDDLFKSSTGPTDADVRLAFELLDYRYNNSLLTIISSEYTFDKLFRIDQAIAGRIKQRCGPYLISIAPDMGKNYRLK